MLLIPWRSVNPNWDSERLGLDISQVSNDESEQLEEISWSGGWTFLPGDVGGQTYVDIGGLLLKLTAFLPPSSSFSSLTSILDKQVRFWSAIRVTS